MSRTDPDKKKPCSAKRTTLLVGEGPAEWAFLTHVKHCFLMREAGISVKVENAHGGSPESVIRTARKLLYQRVYDRCLILMDTDRPWPDKRPTKIGRTQITYAAETPCLEGLLLSILRHPGLNPATASVDQCKRIFHATYVLEDHRTEPQAYTTHFPKSLLEDRRRNCPALDMILKHLE